MTSRNSLPPGSPIPGTRPRPGQAKEPRLPGEERSQGRSIMVVRWLRQAGRWRRRACRNGAFGCRAGNLQPHIVDPLFANVRGLVDAHGLRQLASRSRQSCAPRRQQGETDKRYVRRFRISPPFRARSPRGREMRVDEASIIRPGSHRGTDAGWPAPPGAGQSKQNTALRRCLRSKGGTQTVKAHSPLRMTVSEERPAGCRRRPGPQNRS